MAFMKPEDWQAYQDTLNEWQEDMFQQPVTWESKRKTRTVHGEYQERPSSIELKGLIQYNYFRSWPITKIKDSGEVDKESMILYLNIKYLADNGWANMAGQFMFDPGYDRFIVNGVTYKAMGESQAAQAHDKPLFLFIILKREELSTSDTKYE